MSLRARFGNKFKGSTQEGFEKNKPSARYGNNPFGVIKSGVDTFRPPTDKDQKIRMFPSLTEEYFAEPVDTHFQIGPKKITVTCPSTFGEPCCICDEQGDWFQRAALAKTEGRLETHDEYKAMSDGLRKKPRWVAYVKDCTASESEQRPLAWEFSNTTMDDIQTCAQNRDEGGWIAIDDPDEGRDIYFIKSKENNKSMATINKVQRSDKVTPLGTEAQVDKWIAYIEKNPLKSIIQVLPNEKLREILFGTEDDEELKHGEADHDTASTAEASADPKPTGNTAPAESVAIVSAVSEPAPNVVNTATGTATSDPKPVTTSTGATPTEATTNTAPTAAGSSETDPKPAASVEAPTNGQATTETNNVASPASPSGANDPKSATASVAAETPTQAAGTLANTGTPVTPATSSTSTGGAQTVTPQPATSATTPGTPDTPQSKMESVRREMERKKAERLAAQQNKAS